MQTIVPAINSRTVELPKKTSVLLIFLAAVLVFSQCASAELLLYYPLDQTSGTTAVDATGGNNGTISGGSWQTPGARPHTGPGHLRLSDTPANISVPGLPSAVGDFTLALWLNKSNMERFTWLASAGGASSNLQISVEEGSIPGYVGIACGGVWDENFSAVTSFRTGNWYHLAFVRDSATGGIQCYVNGSPEKSFSCGAGNIDLSSFWIGNYNQLNRPLNGGYDDIGLWDEKLDQAAIETVMNNGIEPDPKVAFESASSGNLESVSPVQIEVALTNPKAGSTYTVDYNVTGGTAIGAAIDFSMDGFCACDLDESGHVEARDIALLVAKWLNEIPYDPADLTHDGGVNADDFAVCARQWLDHCGNNTIVFDPGVTNRKITIEITDDGLAEEDETIELGLSNPSGAQLDRHNHTYYILDPLPRVSFVSPESSGFESQTAVNIPVTLTVGTQAVTVNYAVTGGTAAMGDDYTIAEGTLTFDAGVTSRDITIDVIDDEITEPAETVILTISNPSNARLGQITQHRYTILEDGGVFWDDKHWYYSALPNTRLFVNGQGQLEWTPEEWGQFIARIPTQQFSQPGDVVEFRYLLMTDGDADCPPDSCLICQGRCPSDITCLSGTSDFRIGLFEADGEYITSSGFEVQNQLFTGYKGYEFRFSPNLDPNTPYRWVECPGEPNEEVHKTGNFAKKPVYSDNLLTMNEGLMAWDYIGGFGLPPGQFSLLTCRIERFESDTVELTISLNGETYTATDYSSEDQPQNVDCIAVHMRNPRPFTRFVLDTTD